MQVLVRSFPVDIFTASYRVSGELRPRGNPTEFLNAPDVSTLTVFDAAVVPLRPDIVLEPLMASALHIPRADADIVILGKLSAEDARPLPKREFLVCLTDTYVLKAYFHMGMDTQVRDVFSVRQVPFFIATQVQIISVHANATAVRAGAELAYIQSRAVRAFFEPDDVGQDASPGEAALASG
jgi:hypothetical protein